MRDRIAVANTAATWLDVIVAMTNPYPVVAAGVGQCPKGESEETAFQRYTEHGDDDDRHYQEVGHRNGNVGQLLAKQELDAAGRCHVEVGDRSDLLFPDNADRHQDCREENEQHCRDGGADCKNAFEAGVVKKSHLNAGGRPCLRHSSGLIRKGAHKMIVYAFDITRDCRCTHCVGTIDPCRHFRLGAAASGHGRTEPECEWQSRYDCF